MDKKYFVWVLVLLLAVGILYACGGGGDDDGDDDGETRVAEVSLGEDSDGNGLWDDVEAEIEESDYTEDEKAALEQSAKAMQTALIAGKSGNKTLALEAAAMNSKALRCRLNTMGNFDDSFLENKILDTDERNEAYIDYNGILSDQFFSGYSGENPCE